jgi:hypothetical protein
MGRQFVDGARLNAELTAWRKECKKAKTELSMPDYIAEAVIKIAERLSKKPNFASYTYELTGEAILSCVKYLHNYDPTKGTSGFAYITQICWNSFIRQIDVEQKQSYIRTVCIEREQTPFATQPGDRNTYNSGAMQWLRDENEERIKIRSEDGLHPYERRISQKQAKSKKYAAQQLAGRNEDTADENHVVVSRPGNRKAARKG